MATETLTIERGGRGLISLLQRAVALQDRAMARFSTVSDAAVDVFVTTPFAVIASRRVAGSCSRNGASVHSSATLLAQCSLRKSSRLVDNPFRDTRLSGPLASIPDRTG